MKLGAAWHTIDPRFIQIATLSGLLLASLHLETGVSVAQGCVTIVAALAAQTLLGARRDWRSAAITGLSLTILLRSHAPLVWLLAGVLAVVSKRLIRVGDKHVFNPACFAIVAMLTASGAAWVSPGQWGALAWGAAALTCAAGLVLSRAGRVDTAAAFLAAYTALLAARCAWLGDPWTIPLHQMQSGALLIFTFFMITDPRSTPNSSAGRVIFAMAVALLAYELQFRWQVRTGLFYALFIISPMTPLLDRLLPSARFTWTPQPAGA
jgi:Na+-transporting NADH:ubiquinone oxidoreductase subunit NqrB